MKSIPLKTIRYLAARLREGHIWEYTPPPPPPTWELSPALRFVQLGPEGRRTTPTQVFGKYPALGIDLQGGSDLGHLGPWIRLTQNLDYMTSYMTY